MRPNMRWVLPSARVASRTLLVGFFLGGCANQCGDNAVSTGSNVETVDAATVQEGQLGHAMTAIPPTRPQTEVLRPITLTPPDAHQ